MDNEEWKMENGEWRMENETNQDGLTALAGDVPSLPATASMPLSGPQATLATAVGREIP
jgi:hypothetical protein